jgi:hypothetical protein
MTPDDGEVDIAPFDERELAANHEARGPSDHEHGAKAASEENTRERITPEFFREHSVGSRHRGCRREARQIRGLRHTLGRPCRTHAPFSRDDARAGACQTRHQRERASVR